MGDLLRKSLENAAVVDFGGYSYFVHPLTDGIPEIDPALLREVVEEAVAVADVDVDRIVTVEAMGIPLATALSLRTGIPVSVVRKRKYGLPGEREIGQETGYSKGHLYLNGLHPGDRVLVVDDVISTGGTLDPLLTALHAAGVQVHDVLVLIEKGEGRAEVERKHGLRIRTLAKIEVRDGRVRVLEETA
ncbi:MAG TPA: hypoxanthine/guanine phosphoribosyltransferase [Candidatus Thermoplasmatota archaeon]|nr:hypoxanthine/guanine phosphoribosyltransferase [Candidatus Thermoplasmatota archaeon]